jgi:hypothetical protein
MSSQLSLQLSSQYVLPLCAYTRRDWRKTTNKLVSCKSYGDHSANKKNKFLDSSN